MTKSHARQFVFGAVPEPEIEHLIAEMKREAHLLNKSETIARYRAAGLDVEPDPFTLRIPEQLCRALRSRRSYSLIRIGDGEVSFLALGKDAQTPTLDRFALERTEMQFPDRFRVSEASMFRMQAEMRGAVETADAVGVVGLWRARKVSTEAYLDYLVTSIYEDVRGTSGHWRAIRHLLHLGETGVLAGKQICSAHIYFGLIKQLPRLLGAADRTLCITNRPDAAARLRKQHPAHDIGLIQLNDMPLSLASLSEDPGFLRDVCARLPSDLSGQLVLIGAGPWAELYCAQVKERGGVAVDIGSGFDLLAGRISRPIHQRYLKMRDISLEDFLNGG